MAASSGKHSSGAARRRVVIIGGGFGGLFAARERAFTTHEVGVVSDLCTAVIPAARPATPAAASEPVPPGGPAGAPRRAGA